ncbi:hypothetical protein H6G80_21515 [Nostoc sp. FACHB-87]|nr:hypothetical protein [Nostoc sp. FACHB-190]MBD2456646.1 hypothetical protein [Nostoc sp. FACHB-87]
MVTLAITVMLLTSNNVISLSIAELARRDLNKTGAEPTDFKLLLLYKIG